MSVSKRLLFAALTLVAFVVVSEALLWTIGVPTMFSREDPFEGFSDAVGIYEEDPGHGVYRTRPRAIRHSFNPQTFRLDKPKNGLRVFVIGGSSAYGFPWGAAEAFPRLLEDALKASLPDRVVEVVNAAGMSYGSHRLRVVAAEVLAYQPDLLVIYGGHNEFVETQIEERLAAAVPKSIAGFRLILYRFRLTTVMMRLAALLGSATPAGSAPEGMSTGEMLGVDVVREEQVRTGALERARSCAIFSDNIAAILAQARERGVEVILCTVCANSRDWKPNQSFFDTAISASARAEVTRQLAAARRALEQDDVDAALRLLIRARGEAAGSYAEVDYLLGQVLERAERWDEARVAYAQARDNDAQPCRVVSCINDSIRRFAKEEKIEVVDIEQAFEDASPHGLVGFGLIEDYVHPNRSGHRIIAHELWKRILDDGVGLPVREAKEEVFERTVGEAPAGTAEAAAATPAMLYNLALILESKGEVDKAIGNYESCLEMDPKYYGAAYNLGLLYRDQGRLDAALRAFRQVLAVAPNHLKTINALGTTIYSMGGAPQAEQLFRRAVELDPESSPSWDHLGMTLASQRRFGEAEAIFRKALALDGKNYVAWSNLAASQLFQKKLPEAVASFEHCLALQHDYRPARYGLAESLAASGRVGEARQHFETLLSENPQDQRAAAGLARLR